MFGDVIVDGHTWSTDEHDTTFWEETQTGQDLIASLLITAVILVISVVVVIVLIKRNKRLNMGTNKKEMKGRRK